MSAHKLRNALITVATLFIAFLSVFLLLRTASQLSTPPDLIPAPLAPVRPSNEDAPPIRPAPIIEPGFVS